MRMTHIRRIVSEYYDLTDKQLCCDSRAVIYSLPRQVAMYFSHKLTNCSLTQIARFFGRRNHTTVIGAIKKVLDRMEDDDFRNKVESLELLLAGTDKV